MSCTASTVYRELGLVELELEVASVCGGVLNIEVELELTGVVNKLLLEVEVSSTLF